MVTNDIVLGHIVSSTGIEVDKSKIELIANSPTPKSIKDVKSLEYPRQKKVFEEFLLGLPLLIQILS
jgi:hypothetical protein